MIIERLDALYLFNIYCVTSDAEKLFFCFSRCLWIFLLPVYVHVYNIKVCVSVRKCLWGRKDTTYVDKVALQVSLKPTHNRNNKHDFFSWFLNHSPFLVKNSKRKKRKMFFTKNPTILRLTKCVFSCSQRVDKVDRIWCMVWTFELVVL